MSPARKPKSVYRASPVPAGLIESARATNLLEMAEGYGVKLRRGAANEFCGPCPMCGGRDRFAVNIKRGLWNCRGCSVGGDAIALAMFLDGCDFREAVETLTGERASDYRPKPKTAQPAPPRQDDDDSAKRALASARKIIAEMRPIISSPVAMGYLERIRKIEVGAIADVLSQTRALGWHPSVYYNHPEDLVRGTPEHPLHGQRLGCIIGVMTDVRTAEKTGAISRTYLAPDGTKVGKAKTLGSPRGIVRLSPDDEVGDGLIIGEGLETALTGISIGLRPMWATGDCNVMAQFPVLAGVEALTVIADHDANGAGEKAARDAVARWRAAGREAIAFMPKTLGDLNDVLRGAGR